MVEIVASRWKPGSPFGSNLDEMTKNSIQINNALKHPESMAQRHQRPESIRGSLLGAIPSPPLSPAPLPGIFLDLPNAVLLFAALCSRIVDWNSSSASPVEKRAHGARRGWCRAISGPSAVEEALLALARLCLLTYHVQGAAVTRLPTLDARQQAILDALGTPLPPPRSVRQM